MGIASYAAKSTIDSLVCPHCDATHPDDWECLESDLLSDYAAAIAANTFRSISINASVAPKNQFSFGHTGRRHTGAHSGLPILWRTIYEFIDESIASARVR